MIHGSAKGTAFPCFTRKGFEACGTALEVVPRVEIIHGTYEKIYAPDRISVRVGWRIFATILALTGGILYISYNLR